MPVGVVAAVLVAAAGIDQVRQIDLVDGLRLGKIEQRRKVLRIVHGHGEAQPDLDGARLELPDGGERRVEGAGLAAEAVVHFADAVEADADIVVADRGDAVGGGLVDQRAVGRQADIKAHRLGAGGDVEDVGAQQRLAAREDQHRHAEGLQVVHDPEHLLGRQLAGEIDIAGDRVAVLAHQVAAPDEIPDHHRARRRARWP